MGKAFEENEFTHNLGLDRDVCILVLKIGKSQNQMLTIR